MATVAEMVAVIKANTTELERSLKKSGTSLDSFEKKGGKSAKSVELAFSKLGLAIGVVSTVITGKLVTGLVQTITEFEKLEASLKTVTGSSQAASAAFDRIQDFASTTPFQLQEVVDAFIKLEALGLNPSEEALRSYGNTASAMGKSLNQFIEAVADASTGEFERLKEFGIKARSQGDEVSFIFQGVSTTVKKNAEEIEGYLRGIGQNQFAGAMAEQVDTLNVSLSNLGDSFAKLQKAIGDAGFTAAAKDAVDMLKRMTDSATEFFNLIQKQEEILPRLAQVNKQIADYQERGYLTRKLSLANEEEMLPILMAEKEALEEMLRMRQENPVQMAQIERERMGQNEEEQGEAPIAELSGLGGAEKVEEELQRLQDFFLSKEELELAHHERRIEKIQETLNTEENLTAQQKKKLETLQEKHGKVIESLKKKNEKAIQKEQLDSFTNQISAASNANKVFFALDKAVSISKALLSGKEAVVHAYNFGSKIGGPPMGAAMAGVAAAATASQIAQIASTSFGGGGSVSAGGSGGAVSTQATDSFGRPADAVNAVESEPSRDITINLGGRSTFSRDDIVEIVKGLGEYSEDGGNLRVIS